MLLGVVSLLTPGKDLVYWNLYWEVFLGGVSYSVPLRESPLGSCPIAGWSYGNVLDVQ